MLVLHIQTFRFYGWLIEGLYVQGACGLKGEASGRLSGKGAMIGDCLQLTSSELDAQRHCVPKGLVPPCLLNYRSSETGTKQL